jgi:Ras-related protein Rab-5C
MSYKTIVVGDSGVGKSSILKYLCKGTFDTITDSTIGAAFWHYKHLDPKLSYEIWDTAGQESYRCIVPMYFKNAAVIIMVFDSTRSESFAHITGYWKSMLDKQPIAEKHVLILVENKIDLEHDQDASKAAEEYAMQEGMIYIQTSAKTGIGINWMFDLISKQLNSMYGKKQTVDRNSLEAMSDPRYPTIDLLDSEPSTTTKCTCSIS